MHSEEENMYYKSFEIRILRSHKKFPAFKELTGTGKVWLNGEI